MIKQVWDERLGKKVREYNGYREGDFVTLQGYGQNAIRQFPSFINNLPPEQTEFQITKIYIDRWRGFGFQLKGFDDQFFRIDWIKFSRRVYPKQPPQRPHEPNPIKWCK